MGRCRSGGPDGRHTVLSSSQREQASKLGYARPVTRGRCVFELGAESLAIVGQGWDRHFFGRRVHSFLGGWRLQVLGDGGRCSTVWSVFTARKSGDLYVTPRMLGGAIKVSLHESGSWQVGFTSEYNGQHKPAGPRHWDIWKKDLDLGQGVRRAWYLLVPDEGLSEGRTTWLEWGGASVH